MLALLSRFCLSLQGKTISDPEEDVLTLVPGKVITIKETA